MIVLRYKLDWGL